MNKSLESKRIIETASNSLKTAPTTELLTKTTQKQNTIAFGSPAYDEDYRVERIAVRYGGGETVDGNSMAKKSRIEMDDKAVNDDVGQEQFRGKNDESR